MRFTTGVIRVETDRKHVTLPRVGTIKTHESTRKLARRLETGTARIPSATVRRDAGRWYSRVHRRSRPPSECSGTACRDRRGGPGHQGSGRALHR